MQICSSVDDDWRLSLYTILFSLWLPLSAPSSHHYHYFFLFVRGFTYLLFRFAGGWKSQKALSAWMNLLHKIVCKVTIMMIIQPSSWEKVWSQEREKKWDERTLIMMMVLFRVHLIIMSTNFSHSFVLTIRRTPAQF